MNKKNALTEAIEGFTRGEPAAMAAKAGGVFQGAESKFMLRYFGQPVEIVWPSGTMFCPTLKLSENDRVIILQYLNALSGVKPRASWISFIQLPDGPHHHEPFLLEAIQPLARAFGDSLEQFRSSCAFLKGEEIKMGDAAAVIPALPNVPLAVVMWAADDEFPANANILFDITASYHLTTAALWVLGIELSRKLRGADGQQFSNAGRGAF